MDSQQQGHTTRTQSQFWLRGYLCKAEVFQEAEGSGGYPKRPPQEQSPSNLKILKARASPTHADKATLTSCPQVRYCKGKSKNIKYKCVGCIPKSPSLSCPIRKWGLAPQSTPCLCIMANA